MKPRKDPHESLIRTSESPTQPKRRRKFAPSSHTAACHQSDIAREPSSKRRRRLAAANSTVPPSAMPAESSSACPSCRLFNLDENVEVHLKCTASLTSQLPYPPYELGLAALSSFVSSPNRAMCLRASGIRTVISHVPRISSKPHKLVNAAPESQHNTDVFNAIRAMLEDTITEEEATPAWCMSVSAVRQPIVHSGEAGTLVSKSAMPAADRVRVDVDPTLRVRGLSTIYGDVVASPDLEIPIPSREELIRNYPTGNRAENMQFEFYYRMEAVKD